jgi:multidrug efflux pump subunit AcrA (membrane-fusion protein)
MFQRIKNWLRAHKVRAVMIVLLVGGAWYYFQGSGASTTTTSYVLGQLQRSPLIVTISGSGQVSNSNQLDLKPKVSADIKAIKVVAGQKVKKGDVLALLDSKDLVSTANQARSSLSISQANLNLKLAGPTPENIVVSQRQIDSAKLAYANSQASLKNTQATNALNMSKAQIQLDNAKVSLASAQVQYDNALSSGDLSQTDSSQSLTNAYINAKSTINTAVITLRSALVAADGILGVDNSPMDSNLKAVLSIRNSSYLNIAVNDYPLAKADLANLNNALASAGSTWSSQVTDQLMVQTIKTLQSMSQLETDTHSALLNSITSTNVSQSSLTSYQSSIAGQVSTLNSTQNSIQTSQQAIISAKSGMSSTDLSAGGSVNNAKTSLATAKNNLITAQNNFNQAKLDINNSTMTAQQDVANKKNAIDSAQAQFDLLVAQPRPVDIAAMRDQVAQAADSYRQAADNLSQATIKSPIDATVAKIYQKVGDAASPSTIIITLITNKQMATISLNEVDAAKVRAGQKATMTFSAVDGLEITGEVADIDALGTVTSGVVTYNVNILFDTQDARIKPGMSVSAIIVVNQKIDALSVPSAAVKTDSSGATYVQILNDASAPATDGSVTSVAGPVQKTVVTGLVNDTNTEIVSGLNEGDSYVQRTVISTAATASTQQSGLSLFGGGNRGGGGATRGVTGGGRGN